MRNGYLVGFSSTPVGPMAGRSVLVYSSVPTVCPPLVWSLRKLSLPKTPIGYVLGANRRV